MHPPSSNYFTPPDISSDIYDNHMDYSSSDEFSTHLSEPNISPAIDSDLTLQNSNYVPISNNEPDPVLSPPI